MKNSNGAYVPFQKIAWAPVQSEVTAKDDYIKWTLIGVKPDVAKAPLRSLQDPKTWQVRMTTYYYCKTVGNCTKTDEGWAYDYLEQDKCFMPVSGPIWCMTENMADATYRGYNYPHQAATWLAMYRVARFYDRMQTYEHWDYYLWGAFNTAMQIQQADVGFMDGTVFREILIALQNEGSENATIAGWASSLDTNMRARATQWSTEVFPYGSEFNFDTTGQEEVYVWLQHYGKIDEANKTLDTVLAYMRLIPNWAWHGGARSLADLGNNGKWFVNRGVERLLMHYRAGLNNIPIMEVSNSRIMIFWLLSVILFFFFVVCVFVCGCLCADLVIPTPFSVFPLEKGIPLQPRRLVLVGDWNGCSHRPACKY